MQIYSEIKMSHTSNCFFPQNRRKNISSKKKVGFFFFEVLQTLTLYTYTITRKEEEGRGIQKEKTQIFKYSVLGFFNILFIFKIYF